MLYNPISGITNNPAESTNAVIKKMLNNETVEFFQMVCQWYFYQTTQLVDIQRGFYNDGPFVLNDNKLRSKIYIPTHIVDVVDPEVIPYLAKGKLPPNLLTQSEYKSPSLVESTTMVSLAKSFIAKDKIEFVPSKKVFVVTGLMDKNFMVSFHEDIFTNICKKVCIAFMNLPTYL